jgi:hypothetical protein
MSSDNDNRPDVGSGWRYAGWIIGGLFAVVVIAATFAFLGHDAKTADKATGTTTGTGSAAPHPR